LLAGILFVAFSLPSFAAAVDLVIVANPEVPVNSLSRSALADIYKGYKGRWDNGQKIKVVMLKQGATHEAFAETMVELTPAKLKNLWKKVIFSGAGSPPKVVHSEAQCVAFVAATKGAIGYVSASTAIDGVKVIEVP
jgi:ABC-type phosphate transport system substrate-binding protein